MEANSNAQCLKQKHTEMVMPICSTFAYKKNVFLSKPGETFSLNLKDQVLFRGMKNGNCLVIIYFNLFLFGSTVVRYTVMMNGSILVIKRKF